MTQLPGDATAAEVGGLILVAPGLAGNVEPVEPRTAGLRAAGVSAEPLDVEAHELEATHAVTIDATVTTSGVARVDSDRGATVDAARMVVSAPDPGPGWGQVVLVEDSLSGVKSWSFATDARASHDSYRSRAGLRHYEVGMTPSVPSTGDDRRGFIGAAVKKVVRVLAFKIAHMVIGDVATYFTRRWEESNRPYALWAVGNTAGALTKPGPADWRRTCDGRALLLLHGTASSTGNGFHRLPAATIAALRQRYPGGILAFDHFTLSASPLDNVAWLLDSLPTEDVHLDLDVVCHSRGGLVGRVLAENFDSRFDLSRIVVRRAVFVATPNSGTPLADTDRMSALVDSYTNLFTLIPDNPITDGIDAVVSVVKDVAAAAIDGLSGLQSMRPGGPFLTGLNVQVATPAPYFGIAANYEPADSGVALWAADRLADKAFRDFANDLVVPTDGVFDANGSSRFPVTDRYTFPTTASVHHCNFFGEDAVSEHLLKWLTPI